jgi:hypothetical protein
MNNFGADISDGGPIDVQHVTQAAPAVRCSVLLGVKCCLAGVAVSSIRASWKVMAAYRTPPVDDSENHTCHAQKEPTRSDESHQRPFVDHSLQNESGDSPRQSPGDACAPPNFSAMPNLRDLFWCTFLHSRLTPNDKSSASARPTGCECKRDAIERFAEALG